MKALLGCLMCLVFSVAQTFAISGGPWSGAGAPVNVTGTYAGVLHDVSVGSGNLGIFTLSVPQSGLATGTVLIFTGQRTFSGPISGLADPNTDFLDATLQGIPVVTSGGITIDTLNFHADGTLKARVRLNKKSFGVSAVRLRGTPPTGGAHVITTCSGSACTSCQSGCATDYTVHGFKQSESGS